MQRFFSIVLTVLVLAHATFGCCVHHAHSCDAGCCDADPGSMGDCSCHTDGDHDDSGSTDLSDQPDDSRPEHSEHGPHRCDGGQCSFARTESSPKGNFLNAGDFLAVLILPSTFVQQVADRPFRATSFKPDTACGAIRQHLLLAVFLV